MRWGRVHLGRWSFNPAKYWRRGEMPSTRFLRDSRWYPCSRDIRTINIKKGRR